MPPETPRVNHWCLGLVLCDLKLFAISTVRTIIGFEVNSVDDGKAEDVSIKSIHLRFGSTPVRLICGQPHFDGQLIDSRIS